MIAMPATSSSKLSGKSMPRLRRSDSSSLSSLSFNIFNLVKVDIGWFSCLSFYEGGHCHTHTDRR